MNSIIITIISSLLSGIVATFITVCYYKKQEKRQRKMDLLSKILYYLNGLIEPINPDLKKKLCAHLNQAYIIFNDNNEVLKQLDKIKEGSSNDKIVKLIKLMCNDLKINYTNLNDSFIEKPFN